MSASKIATVKMSAICENFIGAVLRQNWMEAYLSLNRLNMYEMLRGLAALDRLDLVDLWVRRGEFSSLSNLVDLPRIEYAVEVVARRLSSSLIMELPTATGDLLATGQVADAQNFMINPTPLILTRDLTGQLGTTGGNASILTDSDYEHAAATLGVEVAAIMTVAQVESRGKAFASDGRPIVRYELHVFEERTEKVYSTTHPHLSQPNRAAGEIYHNGAQANEWSLIYGAMILRGHEAVKGHPAIKFKPAAKGHPAISGQRAVKSRAATIGGFEEAWNSASWGKFQVMGFNAGMCGWGSVNEFVYNMYQSEAKHLEAFINYCVKSNLTRHLKSHDWQAFAKGYNGSDYKKNHYDTNLDTVYRRISAERKTRGLTP